mmetsp:Transcript_61582/g.71649  ORF Transcript_61582/g.71649 Transcript_61582/m.71649 type:complete len:143 (-) Transcript_61582:33-461(-)
MDYIEEVQKQMITEIKQSFSEFENLAKRSIITKPSEDFGLDLLDAEKQMMIHRMNHDSKFGPMNLVWDSEADILVTNGPSTHIEIHDKRQSNLIRTFDEINPKDKLQWDPMRETVSTVSADGTTHFLDIGTGKIINTPAFLN